MSLMRLRSKSLSKGPKGMPIALPPIPTHPTALGISLAHSALPAASGDGRQAVKRSRKRLHCAEVVERSSRRSASNAHHGAPPLGPSSAPHQSTCSCLREISEEGWKQPKASAEYISEFRDGSFLEPRSSNTVGYGTFSPTSYKLQSSSRTQ